MPHIDSLPHARPTLLSYNAVMKRLDCSKATFHRLADSGELGQVYRIGMCKKVTEKGVEDYLKRVCDVEQAKPAAVKINKPKQKNPKDKARNKGLNH